MLFKDWSAQHTAWGLALTPPQGRAGGAIAVIPRQAPLVPLHALVRQGFSNLPAEALRIGPIDRLTTIEGEHAAVCTVEGIASGRPFLRCIGAVYGDDFYTKIDGGTSHPELFADFRQAVRELTSQASLGLGELRLRRFEYTPPAGWMGRKWAQNAHWHPLDYPNHMAGITVFPARPLRASAPSLLHDVLDGRALSHFSTQLAGQGSESEPVSLLTRRGLCGTRTRILGAFPDRVELVVCEAILRDDRFEYAARLQAAPARASAAEEIFNTLVDSIVPIPAPQWTAEPTDG